MSFFTAVLANDGASWRAKDVDVEDCASLDDLAEMMRDVAHGANPVLTIIEREDGWFALVRVDGDDPATLFVSDLPSAQEGHYAQVVSSAADLDVEVPDGVHAYDHPEDSEEDSVDERTDDEKQHDAQAEDELREALGGGALLKPDPDPEPTDAWAGDPGLLSDLGVSAARLVEITNGNPDDPAVALAEVAEVAGFADLIEALR